MPELIPNKKFIADLENFKKNPALIKKIANYLKFLEANSFQPGLNIEWIATDPTAWSARVDIKYRISFDPSAFLENNASDWTPSLKLLRILDLDDLYRSPH